MWQRHLGSVRRNTRNSAPREEKVESSSHCPIHQSQTRGAFGAGGAVCKKSVCVQTYARILLSQISVFLGLAEAGKYSSSSRPPHSKAYSLLRRRRWAEPVTAGRKPKDDPVPPAPLQPRTLKTRGTSKRPSLQSSGEEGGQAPPHTCSLGSTGYSLPSLLHLLWFPSITGPCISPTQQPDSPEHPKVIRKILLIGLLPSGSALAYFKVKDPKPATSPALPR